MLLFKLSLVSGSMNACKTIRYTPYKITIVFVYSRVFFFLFKIYIFYHFMKVLSKYFAVIYENKRKNRMLKVIHLYEFVHFNKHFASESMYLLSSHSLW